jgi:hypothetical protein
LEKLGPKNNRSAKIDELEEIARINNLYNIFINKNVDISRGLMPDSLTISEMILVKSSQCYHTTIIFEALLKYRGFKTRHAFLAKNDDNLPKWYTVIKPNLSSHAVLEVKTKNGLLLIDPYQNWQAITKDNKQISLQEVYQKGINTFKWKKDIHPALLSTVYNYKFEYYYGLYSRHGLFFKPYLKYFPDIDWKIFAYNFVTP